ncbi:MAG: M48 family metalloprotease [Pseudomonadota bacterium]
MQLSPLPYHDNVCAHLKQHESGLWQWFVSDNFSSADSEHTKLELLKSCYRMSADHHADLYRLAEEAADRLEIDCPITLYQAQVAGAEPNAALYFFADELCVVLSGAIEELLAPNELRSLFGHEFAHHKLYTDKHGEYFAASRLLAWCAAQPDCHEAYVETARRYQLQTELYADSGAAFACGSAETVMSCLIKVSTGLKSVAVLDYLAQAEEILSKEGGGSEGSSHPEVYLRVKALQSGVADPSDYTKLVRGKLDTRRLDVFDQRELAALTYQIFQVLGTDERFQTDEHRVLARQYFPSFTWTDAESTAFELCAQIKNTSELTQTYLAYLLLDLVTADRDDSYPLLGPVLLFATELGVYKPVESTVRKELKLRKADTDKALQDAQRMTGENADHD